MEVLAKPKREVLVACELILRGEGCRKIDLLKVDFHDPYPVAPAAGICPKKQQMAV